MSEHREALWTNYSPVLRPDTQVLNSLVDSVAGAAAGAGGISAGPPAGAGGASARAGIAGAAGGGIGAAITNLDPARGADAASSAILAISGSIANTLLTGSGSIGEAAEELFSLGGTTTGGTAVAGGAASAAPAGIGAAPPLETVAMINNAILKSHFLEMTTNFLAPFGPYLRASAPGRRIPLL